MYKAPSPNIMLQWRQDKKSTGPEISQDGFSNILYTEKSKQGLEITVLGSPIINGKVDRKTTAQWAGQQKNLSTAISQINGEFLLVLWDARSQILQIFTDRFSSYPAYWAQQGNNFAMSYAYLPLARHCRDWKGFALRPEKAYEFFMLQRLMGTDTHDTLSQYLPPASCLTITRDQDPQIKTYWSPSYEKNNHASKKQLTSEFAGLFTQSVQARQGGNEEKTGIFLSGGHDSRLVAAYTDKKATCYTLSFQNNLEVTTAQKIAQITGHDHIFCHLNENMFEDVLDDATALSGAMYANDHAIFFKDALHPPPKDQIYLHGHGLDYMYQGMYLHTRRKELFGYQTYVRDFTPFPPNLPQHFIDTVSFRLKYDLRGNFLNRDKAAKFDEALYASVQNEYQKGQTLSDDPSDHWEHLILSQISRHYPYSNVLSKRTCGEVRTPSLDNDLYDFYLSLPQKYRLHADIIRGALYHKNPAIARMPAANHALPAGWGPYAKTACQIGRKLLRHGTFNKYFHVPSGKDRTWPDRDSYFATHQSYYNKALECLHDQDFQDFICFIDWKALKDHPETLLNQPFGGAFLVTLLSYYRFYKAVEV